MGAWGAELFDDDVALDARALFEEAVESGAPPGLAADHILASLPGYLEDTDDEPVLMLALAALLLDGGVADHPVLRRAREIIETGDGLERWQEAGAEALSERLEVYRRLAARLP
jgi:hypothetical protein